MGQFKLVPEDIKEIAEKYLSGIPTNKIAPLYAVSKATIINYLKKMGVKRRDSSVILKEANRRREEKSDNNLPSVELFSKLYFEQKLSLLEVARKLEVPLNKLRVYLTEKEIDIRNRCERSKVTAETEGFKNRKIWNKGLSKKDSKVRELSLKMMATKKIRGVSYRGTNNPMYGKVTHGKVGYREDLGHYTRSTWEANFARILNYLNLKYEYERHTFPLSTGETYTPDFYIPQKDTFYEVKGFIRNNKHLEFQKDFPDKKLVLVSDKLYKRLLLRYSSKIKIQDKIKSYSKEEVILSFIEHFTSFDINPSVQQFCKLKNISPKCILSLFGKSSNLIKDSSEELSKIEKNRLKIRYIEFFSKYKKIPTSEEFKRYYKRSPKLISKYYYNYYNFKKDIPINDLRGH